MASDPLWEGQPSLGNLCGVGGASCGLGWQGASTLDRRVPLPPRPPHLTGFGSPRLGNSQRRERKPSTQAPSSSCPGGDPGKGDSDGSPVGIENVPPGGGSVRPRVWAPRDLSILSSLWVLPVGTGESCPTTRSCLLGPEMPEGQVEKVTRPYWTGLLPVYSSVRLQGRLVLAFL